MKSDAHKAKMAARKLERSKRHRYQDDQTKYSGYLDNVNRFSAAMRRFHKTGEFKPKVQDEN